MMTNTHDSRIFLRRAIMVLASIWTVAATSTNVFVVPPDLPGAAPAPPYTNWTTAFTNCCASINLPGPDNITNYPAFVNPAGDYRLQPDSPCVNAGINLNWMDGMLDMDGHSRIDRWTRRVDMGAYEYLHSGTLFDIRWR